MFKEGINVLTLTIMAFSLVMNSCQAGWLKEMTPSFDITSGKPFKTRDGMSRDFYVCRPVEVK